MPDDYEMFKDKISESEFESRIKSKIKDFQGLLTRDGAISIIASELGIPLTQKPADISISIGDILEGMTNIEVVGKIVRISEPKEFVKRTTGTTGKVRRLEIADEAAKVPVVLWDEKVDESQGFCLGDVVKVFGGFAKKGLNGGLELTIQRRGYITKSDLTIDIEEPKCKRVDIGSLEEGMENIRVIGAVANISDIREYERDGRKFKVSSLFLKDSTGQVRVSLWNKNAEEASALSQGDVIEVEGCQAKYGFNGIELQTNSYTALNPNPVLEGISMPTIDNEVQISDLTSDKQFFTVRGTISRIFEPRTFERDDGSQGLVASFEIEDETGVCRVTLWDDKARILESIAPGTSLALEGCRAREGMDGVEISVSSSGRVIPQLPSMEEHGITPEGLARVLEIKDGAIKAVAKAGPLLILTDNMDFLAGDLIHYKGVVDNDSITAELVEPSLEEYPSLDELTSPQQMRISDLDPGSMVKVQGLVRMVAPVMGYNIMRIDDGSGIITGYGHEAVAAGREYNFLANTFSNGNKVELFTHALQPVDNEKEAYRLLELFEEV